MERYCYWNWFSKQNALPCLKNTLSFQIPNITLEFQVVKKKKNQDKHVLGCQLVWICHVMNFDFMQHAVVFVNGGQYYGAKASLNVWTPRVTNQYEFSLSQLWIISGSFGHDLNTIEAGWQVQTQLISFFCQIPNNLNMMCFLSCYYVHINQNYCMYKCMNSRIKPSFHLDWKNKKWLNS